MRALKRAYYLANSKRLILASAIRREKDPNYMRRWRASKISASEWSRIATAAETKVKK